MAENQMSAYGKWRAAIERGHRAGPSGPVYKQLDSEIEVVEDRRIRFTVTTANPDRERDVVDSNGVDVTAFKRNPIITWAHDYHSLPIGRAVAIETRKDSIQMVIEFATADLNPLAEQVFRMVKAGFLKATSIGFRPLEWSYNEERRGVDFLKVELLEVACVPVPANAEALIAAAAAGIDVAVLKGWAERVLADLPDDAKTNHSSALPPAEKLAIRGRTSPAPLQWNPALSKAFDVAAEQFPARSVEQALAAKYCDCEIKHLYHREERVMSARMGSFLVALDEVLGAQAVVDDVRNLGADGREEPPLFETLRLNSTTEREFLIDGLRFARWHGDNPASEDQLVVRVTPRWYGLQVTLHAARERRAAAEAFWTSVAARAAELNFLKGEAFSLSGEFLARDASAGFDELFLTEKNAAAVRRLAELVRTKGADMENRGALLVGPPGCLHGDTPIHDPVDGSSFTVAEREQMGCSFSVWALDDDGLPVIADAEAPWRYEPADMVRLSFASGRRMTVTEAHRFWAGDLAEADHQGYVTAKQLVAALAGSAQDVVLPSAAWVSEPQQESSVALAASNAERDQSTRVLDDRHYSEKAVSFLERYSTDHHPHGGRPLRAGDSGRDGVPSRDDVQQHNHVSWRTDDRVGGGRDNDHTASCRRAMPDYPIRSGSIAVAEWQCQRSSELAVRLHAGIAVVELPRSQLVRGRTDLALSSDEWESTDSLRRVSPYSLRDSNGRPYYTPDRLISTERVGRHHYYDFHVPRYENYLAEGIFHHNTGKTLAGRVLMNQVPATFVWVSSRDFHYGGSFGTMAQAFELARECAPTVLFLEDVDNWLTPTTVDLFKTEMDGIAQYRGIVTILTSNYPEMLPKALIDRPGRFHDVLRFDLPDEAVRRAMLQRWMPGLTAEQMGAAVQATAGYSGAHLRELARFAAIIAEQDGLRQEDALARALAKLAEQRDLITAVQSQGSHYRAPAMLVDTMIASPSEILAVAAAGATDKGSSPRDISTVKADEATAWKAPTLADFTAKPWSELDAGEKRKIAGHYAWSAEMPPAAFGSLKLPHHEPVEGKVVWRGVAACVARMNQADIPAADMSAVKAHIRRHYQAFKPDAEMPDMLMSAAPFDRDEVGWKAYEKAAARAQRRAGAELLADAALAELLEDYGFDDEAAVLRAEPTAPGDAACKVKAVGGPLKALEPEAEGVTVVTLADEPAGEGGGPVLVDFDDDDDADPATAAVLIDLAPDAEEQEPVTVDAAFVAATVRSALADLIRVETRAAVNELRGRVD